VTWFCRVALDQLRFMQKSFDLDTLGERLQAYARHQVADSAGPLVEEVLRRGEIAHGDAMRITGRSERSARAALGKLVHVGLLVSDTPKGPVRLQFSERSADALFPRLFAA
jgi:hypothetical protein